MHALCNLHSFHLCALVSSTVLVYAFYSILFVDIIRSNLFYFSRIFIFGQRFVVKLLLVFILLIKLAKLKTNEMFLRYFFLCAHSRELRRIPSQSTQTHTRTQRWVKWEKCDRRRNNCQRAPKKKNNLLSQKTIRDIDIQMNASAIWSPAIQTTLQALFIQTYYRSFCFALVLYWYPVHFFYFVIMIPEKCLALYLVRG